MPISVALLTSSTDTVDRSAYTTASISPTGGRLLKAYVAAEKASGAPDAPSVSGNGVTWTLEEEASYASIAGRGIRAALYRATGASPSAGAVTFDFGGVTVLDAQWIIAEFAGVDVAVGNQGVVQSVAATGSGSGNQPMTATLASFASATNATFMVAHQVASGPPTFTPEDGYTQVGNPVSGQIQSMGIFLAGQDTTPVMTSSNTAQPWAAIAVELAELVGGAPTPRPHLLLMGSGL